MLEKDYGEAQEDIVTTLPVLGGTEEMKNDDGARQRGRPRNHGELISADGRRLVQLYNYERKDMLIDTQYGTITYLQWLRKEKERIELGIAREVKIHSLRNGKVALYANDVTGQP